MKYQVNTKIQSSVLIDLTRILGQITNSPRKILIKNGNVHNRLT